MRSTGVGSLIQLDISTSHPVIDLVWLKRNEAITNLSFFFIFAHQLISHGRTYKNLYVSRVQLHCALEVAHGIIPMVLTAIDVSDPFKNSCIVGQGTYGDSELVTGAIVIKIAVVKVRTQSEVRLAGLWFDTK